MGGRGERMSFSAITNRLSYDGLSLYLLVLGCLFVAPWGADWAAVFELDRGEIKGGEYWRFFTGPLVHRSWEYLGFTVAAIFVLQQLFGREFNTIVLAWGYAIIATVIGICMLAFSRLGAFEGMAPLLHGLFAYGAILAMRREPLLGWGVLVLVGAKVVWEQIEGGRGLVAELLGLPASTDAHLYGFAAGVVLGAVMVASVARAGSE